MNETDWIIIEALYKYKSLSKAGRALYLSQPALTKRLQHIEKELDVKIAARGAKGLYFTPQGEYLAKRAREVISLLDEVKLKVQTLHGSISGTLKIGVSIYFSKYVLPELLQNFRKEYADVDFEVKTGHSSDVYHMLSNKEVHVGFLRSDYDWQDKKILLFEDKLCLASKEKIKLEQLPELDMIDYKKDQLLKNMVDKWWTSHFNVPPNITMEVGSADICKEMVVRNLGYGLLPYGMIDLKKDRLFVTDLKREDGTLLKRKTWLYYYDESLSNVIIDTFVEFVKGYTFN